MTVQIKICGLTTKDAVRAAHEADYIGLVFHSDSPRFIKPNAAAAITAGLPLQVEKVGLFVNPNDSTLAQILAAVPLDIIQLHGDEPPQRVRDIAVQTGFPVMKALRVATAADINTARAYEDVADWLLFDSRSTQAYGGTGEKFDWTLLQSFKSRLPWMLSGGLNAANVGSALAVLKPAAVDVSSGVEIARGQKDPPLIKDFIRTVKSL